MKKILFFLSLVFFLIGCSSKHYFEPNEVAGYIEYDGNLPASIKDVLRDGATLENGQFISKRGLEKFHLPKNYIFINRTKDYYIAVHKCKEVTLYDRSGKKIFSKSFPHKSAVAANIKNGILALVFDDDSLMLYDTTLKKVLYTSKQTPDIAVDTKIANPYFLGDLAIFPTLDGKLVVVNTLDGKELKNIVIGSEKLFNNIIFLDVIDNNLIAATPKRIVSVTPTQTHALDLEISDVLYVKGRVYILTKDGRVILTDGVLTPLKERKFPFAHFVGAIYGEYIYLIERGGYIIALDKDMVSANIFKFPDFIEDYIFTTQDTVYYGDKYFRLNRIK